MILCDRKMTRSCANPAVWLLLRETPEDKHTPSGAACETHVGIILKTAFHRYETDRFTIQRIS